VIWIVKSRGQASEVCVCGMAPLAPALRRFQFQLKTKPPIYSSGFRLSPTYVYV